MPGVPPARYGYLGPAGTFTEAALRSVTDRPSAAGSPPTRRPHSPPTRRPRRADLTPYASVALALEAVRSGDVDGAMVPLENSVEGSVATTLDELAGGDLLQITREVLLPVRFALLGRSGTARDAVRTVATHPHAEAQCRRWLRDVLPGASVVLAPSTADAARQVGAGAYDAAVSAPIAAQEYGLQVLAEDIQDSEGAVTRFVLVSRPGPAPAPTGADRTTLAAFIADDQPGALLALLTEFAVRGINLTRIESRPSGLGLGRYFFSIDCEGHLADARVGEALAALHRTTLQVRYLGSYPRADEVASDVRPGTADGDFRSGAAWLERLRAGSAG